MAEVTIHPNAIDTAGWNSPSGAATDIDEPIASADGNTYAAGADSGAAQLVLGLGAHGLSDADTITNVTIDIRYLDGGSAGTKTCDIDFIIGGTSQGTVNTGAVTGSLANYTGNNTAGWNSDWTASQLDGAQVGLTPQESGMPGTNLPAVDCVDVVITYTEAATDDVDFAGTNPGAWGAFVMPKALSTYIPYGMRMAPESTEPSGIQYAPAVDFPGTTSEGYDRSGADTGLADTAFFSFSAWIIRNSATNQGALVWSNSGGRQVVVRLNNSTANWRVFLTNATPTTVCDWTGANNGLPASANWQHLCGWVDVSAGAKYFAVDGVEDTTAATTLLTGETIDHTSLGVAVGAANGLGSFNLDGAISQVAVWPRKIDWSVAGTLALVNNGGKAVLLPDDGNIDAGGTADYVFNKVKADAHQNGGDANDWASATAGLSDIQGPELA